MVCRRKGPKRVTHDGILPTTACNNHEMRKSSLSFSPGFPARTGPVSTPMHVRYLCFTVNKAFLNQKQMDTITTSILNVPCFLFTARDFHFSLISAKHRCQIAVKHVIWFLLSDCVPRAYRGSIRYKIRAEPEAIR